AREALDEVVHQRSELEAALHEAEQAHLAAVRAIADRREGVARLSSQVESMRSRVNDTAEEIERLTAALEEAAERAAAAEQACAEAEEESGGQDEDDASLQQRYESAKQAREAARERVSELVAAERAAEREIASW
ncbi:hypothetical protein LH612_35545, partial [Klebsiella pneumoniae]|nr:hypothetical protein [Klebsiella pneumoniae]